MSFLDILKTRRITESTFNLYKKNLEKLNDGNEVKNIIFLKSKSFIIVASFNILIKRHDCLQ